MVLCEFYILHMFEEALWKVNQNQTETKSIIKHVENNPT